MVQKLSSASGNVGTSDEVSLSGKTDGVGVPLTPLGEGSTDTSNGNILKVDKDSKSIAISDKGGPRSIPPNQEHAVNLQDLSATDEDTRTQQV